VALPKKGVGLANLGKGRAKSRALVGPSLSME
jgi:hypothetical protein